MESLRTLNLIVWKQIFALLSGMTQNVFCVFLIISIFAGTTIACIRIIKKQPWYVFGLPETVICISASGALQGLPFIHGRLHNALSISSDLIFSSSDYKRNIELLTDNVFATEGELAEYLYKALQHNYVELQLINPNMVYEHLFSTYEKIVSGIMVRDMTIPIYQNGMSWIWFFLFLFAYFAIFQIKGKLTKKQLYIQVAVVIIFSLAPIGCMVTLSSVIIVECIIFNFRKICLKSQKTTK